MTSRGFKSFHNCIVGGNEEIIVVMYGFLLCLNRQVELWQRSHATWTRVVIMTTGTLTESVACDKTFPGTSSFESSL